MRSLDSLWGNEASLLLGDYLLSISFQILTRLEQIEILQCVAWATRNIARGQILELSERASSQNDPEKCLQVYREKDASLLAAAAKCGAIWGGADSNLQEKLMTFGEKWGVALVLKNDLQILDDTQKLHEKIISKLSFFPLIVWLGDLKDAELEEWQKKIYEPGTFNMNYYNDFVGEILVKQISKGRSASLPGNVVTFSGAKEKEASYGCKLFEVFPKVIGPQDLSLGNAELQKITITFAYRYWERLGAEPSRNLEDYVKPSLTGKYNIVSPKGIVSDILGKAGAKPSVVAGSRAIAGVFTDD